MEKPGDKWAQANPTQVLVRLSGVPTSCPAALALQPQPETARLLGDFYGPAGRQGPRSLAV